ncbi:McrB family protein [Pedobacter mucosus]|uniref:McrB family protein n=1 Tax=Pedobacter mucosus TaxID=2895286 RepID=UPI001EE418A4|nr:AAA family ATPase [Pedobacter mucosus]UKT65220.1 AAA family ATPase [Pedobacter mucosus]
MLTYHEYEKVVYDWLIAKRDNDPNFTFSLRKKVGKGLEKDIFIGTEKSKYFATTFWALRIDYPGSSGEATGIIFKLGKIDYSYFIELNQTNKPHNEQNKAVLRVLKEVCSKLPPDLEYAGSDNESNAMFNVKILPTEPVYVDLNLMFTDIDKQLAVFVPIVDEVLANEKSVNPSFIGQRITNEEFSHWNNKLETRVINNTDFFGALLIKLGEVITEKYFDTLRKLIFDLDLEITSEKVYFNYEKDKLIFGIGQRYVLNIENNQFFRLISKNKVSDNGEEFTSEPKAFLTNYPLDFDLQSHYDDLLIGAKETLAITEKSGFFKFDKKDFREMAFRDNNLITIEKQSADPTLNLILFGPPGTGKTYRLQKEYFKHFTVNESSLSRESYLENLINDLNWWQLISIVSLDLGRTKVRHIYEHELIQIKEKLSSSKTVMPTIWGQLQAHTVMDCVNVNVEKRSEPLYFSKDKDSFWSINEGLLRDNFPEGIEILQEYKDFKPRNNKSVKNYEFITFHQSFSYEDFIEGIKPNLTDDSDNSELKYHIEDGIFKRLCKRAESDPKNKYCIFIDEINRGNVSAIFGELITLIESDKRIGNTNELKIQLPYSKDLFGVPKNLYIIGTMNTADRSVESLDTALRRRFSFEEMLPNAELVSPEKMVYDLWLKHADAEWEDEDWLIDEKNLYTLLSSENLLRMSLLKKKEISELLNNKEVNEKIFKEYFDDNCLNLKLILEKINKRLEKLLSRDHTIGHSFFLGITTENDLYSAFYNKIIPLLQEYFFGDYGKMGLVIGSDFVEEIKESEVNLFAIFDYEDRDLLLEKKVYRIKDFKKEISLFISALKKI